MAKRDTYKYELTKGNKVVYVGITNNPERREKEHHQDKDFDKMRIVGNISTLDGASKPEINAKVEDTVGNISTLDGASKWESDRIKTYMNNHNGNTPLYNQNEHGK